MPDHDGLRRKLTVQAHGRRLVLIKKPNETFRHVLMKAGLWALLLPDYPEVAVEVGVGDRFKPDLVALRADGRPRLWAEAGDVSPHKIASLARRFRDTRFVVAKWGHALTAHAEVARRALRAVRNPPPFELLGFPPDPHRILDEGGHVVLRPDDVRRVVLTPR